MSHAPPGWQSAVGLRPCVVPGPVASEIPSWIELARPFEWATCQDPSVFRRLRGARPHGGWWRRRAACAAFVRE